MKIHLGTEGFNNASPSSGSTATTTQPDELLIGAIGFDDKSQSVTASSGLTNLTASATSGISQGVLMQPAYRIVNVAGQYDDSGSANAPRSKSTRATSTLISTNCLPPSALESKQASIDSV